MTTEARRAIEALRAGVPNVDAVRYLGPAQPKIMDRFHALVEREGEGLLKEQGFLVEGGFGSGKSHILRCLQQEALRKNFATSLVVVSKETPLSDLEAVYKAAIRVLTLPDRSGGDLSEVALKLDTRSASYAAFAKMVLEAESPLDPLFAATLRLSQELSSNEELADRIHTFWAGGRISVADLRKELRHNKEWGIQIKARKTNELAPQRFLFASQLMRAAKYRGWVILLDEVELVASFSLRARAKAYANLAWLLGDDPDHGSDLFAVCAMTDDFRGIIDRRQDRVNIPLKLSERDPEGASRAQLGLHLIAEDAARWESIIPLTTDDLDRIYREVSSLYRQAFDWESPEGARPPYDGGGRSMRMHVREWITRWDLERLDPSYRADIESEALRPDLTEREGMEGFSEEDEDDARTLASLG